MSGQGRRRWLPVLILACACAVPVAAQAQVEAPPRETGAVAHAVYMLNDATLCDVYFVNPSRGWAVGDRGAIWHTDDGGQHWRLQQSPINCRLEAVYFVNDEIGWAVGGTVQPYTHLGEGVVLRTLDGGRRWTRLKSAALPMLKSVKFTSPTRGWAVGAPSAMYESGIFRTQDGGRSWSPVKAPAERWLCADFLDDSAGVVAGEHGQLSVLAKQRAIAARLPQLGMRSIRDIRLADHKSGWLAGDGGLVLSTSDTGQTWEIPPRAIPPAAMHEFDYKALAVYGPAVWVVGSPGSFVLHSPDGGRSWRMQPTGQTLPLNGIHFADAKRGWAVGAMGAILSTNDGGATWRRQRSGGERAAALIVVSDMSDVPLEFLAKFGADEGYLCAAHVVGHHAQAAKSSLVAADADRLAAAVTLAGGTAATQSWRYPLPDSRMLQNHVQVAAAWDQLHAGRATPTLKAELVRAIRTWRPDVIITHADDSIENGKGCDALIGSLVRWAAAAAADTNEQSQQLTHAGLQPWQAKKLFALCPENVAGDVGVASSSLALRWSQTLSEYSADAHATLAEEPSARSLHEFRLESHRVAQEAARRDIFSGLAARAGGATRRRLGEAPTGDIDSLQRSARKRRNVEQLIARTEAIAIDDDAWLGQLNELTRDLDDRAAARVIYQLANRYSQSGRADLAIETHEIVAQRYRNDPLASSSLVWLIDYHTSSEATWRRRALSQPDVQPATIEFSQTQHPREQPRIAPVVFDQPADAPLNAATNTPALHNALAQVKRAAAMFQILQQTNPQASAQPALQLAMATTLRAAGDEKQAESLYRQIAGNAAAGPWQSCARAELWLNDPRGNAPKPLGKCAATGEKPYLDGQIEEAFWQSAEPIVLQHGAARQPSSTVVRLARDDEFLFLAIECRRMEGALHDGPEAKRRDADLKLEDRVVIHLDVNRDWNTAYEIGFDQRGRVNESCAGDGSWNPNFYVARAGDHNSWRIEAAIPFDELQSQPPAAREVWAIDVVRITPGIGVHSWPAQAALEEDELHGMGLLLFP